MTAIARTPAGIAFVRCLRTAALPAVIAAAAGVAGSRWFAAPVSAVAASPGAETPWLQLPVIAAAAVCAFAAAWLWPLFAAGRPGADQVRRLQRGPLRGTGAVIAGALAAQLVLVLPLVLVGSRWFGAPAEAESRIALAPPADALLDGTGRPLEFAMGSPAAAVEVQLRPLAAPPRGALVPTRLEVLADGERLTADDGAPHAEVEQTGTLLRFRFAPRRITSLRIVQTAGNVPLVFPAGSVVVVGAERHSATWNAMLAAVLSVVPTFVALAIAALCGLRAALPTVAGVIGTLLFVQTLGGAGPADDALRAVMRGHWLPSTDVFLQSVPSLAAGSLAMIATMLLSRQRPR